MVNGNCKCGGTCSSCLTENEGRWVTLGSGVHAFIDSGVVTKGPSHLTGKSIRELKKVETIAKWHRGDPTSSNTASKTKAPQTPSKKTASAPKPAVSKTTAPSTPAQPYKAPVSGSTAALAKTLKSSIPGMDHVSVTGPRPGRTVTLKSGKTFREPADNRTEFTISTHAESNGTPITIPGHAKATGVGMRIDHDSKYIHIDEMTSKIKGAGTKMVDAIVKHFPGYKIGLTDWSTSGSASGDSFWDKMSSRHKGVFNMAAPIRLSAKQARTLNRRCRAAGIPSPVTINALGKLVINPAVSEAQRKYLNVTFGHDWVKEHGFDNKGSLPDYVGKGDGDKKTKEENERRMMGKCSATENNFFGRFWHWLTRNGTVSAPMTALPRQETTLRRPATALPVTNDPAVAMRTGVAQPSLQPRRADGKFGQGDELDQPSDEDIAEGNSPEQVRKGNIAYKRGISTEELDKQQGVKEGKKVTKNRRHLIVNARDDKEDDECPECGGQMEEDENGKKRCEECGYVENAVTGDRVDQDATARRYSPQGGDARPDGRHNRRLQRQTPIDVVDDDGDPYLDEDDHSDEAREEQIKATQNQGQPVRRYDGPDPHDASKQAAASTVMTEHDDARDHAMDAVDHSGGGDSQAAAESHEAAADTHEDASVQSRQAGDHPGADDHDQSAAMHRKAASMHRANMAFNRRQGMTRNQWANLLMNDPKLTTNMPAGGAFSGAKAAGYSAAQAAAMAGKLEGSYAEEGSSHTREAKSASEHAEKTGSKGAHKRAAAAHKAAAEHHEEQGHAEFAGAHRAAARSHAAKAGRATRNSERIEFLNDIIANCTCAYTRRQLKVLLRNEASATGKMGDEIYAGRQDDDDDPYGSEDDDDDFSDVNIKKKKEITGNSLSPQDRETLVEARRVVHREKQGIVARLVANVRNPMRREARIEDLMGKPINELRGMLELVGNSEQPMPATPMNTGMGGEIMPLYGAGNADIIDNEGGADGGDLLDCPTINFRPAKAV